MQVLSCLKNIATFHGKIHARMKSRVVHSLKYHFMFLLLLPPRFLVLVELWALPCPSILLLPTQPPITVPTLQTKDKNHNPSQHVWYKLHNRRFSHASDALKWIALYENHHRWIMTAQHSLFLWRQTGCYVYVTCTASWPGHAHEPHQHVQKSAPLHCESPAWKLPRVFLMNIK